MKENAAHVSVPAAWWRFLIVAAIFVSGYFATTVWLRPIFGPVQTRPAALVAVILLSAAAGVLAGRREAAAMSETVQTGPRDRRSRRTVSTEPKSPRHRGRRSRKDVGRSAARAGLAGLAGCALILNQALPTSSLEWVFLGGVALGSGGAGHSWVMTRHYESVKPGLTD